MKVNADFMSALMLAVKTLQGFFKLVASVPSGFLFSKTMTAPEKVGKFCSVQQD